MQRHAGELAPASECWKLEFDYSNVKFVSLACQVIQYLAPPAALANREGLTKVSRTRDAMQHSFGSLDEP